ncbi:hypothetical protein CEQ90_18760 [Lewinellaceae bacterium SD302]|nr:hypothetical protein CEQ90_18760 [Lewinellaceae bacterium SD302]
MPHTTVTIFRFDSPSARWWIFTQMGLAIGKLGKTPGLNFGRLLGSGGGNGFSLWPNFGIYAWLGQWESRAAVEAFERNDWYQTARAKASGITTFHLRPTMAHGEWAGEQPFPLSNDYDPTKPVAVITRATIRTRKLPDFWRYVPRTSRSVYDHPERKLSIGIGEYPIFMQATFSYWTSGKAMQDFAYKSNYHKEVVQLTRERNWYKEELFARFTVLEIEKIDGGAMVF